MLTVEKVAERYGVSEGTVLAWISAGELKALNVARGARCKRARWRVSEAALAAFEEARTQSRSVPQKGPRPQRQANGMVKFY